MHNYSYIDKNKEDLLRFEGGSAVVVTTTDWGEALSWLYETGPSFGWSKNKVDTRILNWDTMEIKSPKDIYSSYGEW